MATPISNAADKSDSIERSSPAHSITLEAPDPDMIAVLRGKSPAERLQIANEMWRFAARMTQAQVERAWQGASAEDVMRETARRMANGSW